MGAAGVLAAVLVLGVVGPAHTQEAPTGEGTSTLSVVPAVLDVSGLPVAVDATLGTLIADATNVSDPVARLALTNLGAAGQTAPEFGVSSADGNQSGTAEREAGAGGVGASVGLVEYLVESGADNAVADLSALAAEITTPLGLGADVGAQGLGAVATPTETASEVLVTITGLELGLGDLLPADVLDQLPLGVALDLLDSLGVALPTDLAAQVADVEALVASLDDALAAGDLLPADLDGVSDLPAVSDALDALDLARADLLSATAAVAALEDLVADLLDGIGILPTDLDDQVESVLAQVQEATAAVEAAEALLEDALADAGLGDLLALLDPVDELLTGLDLESLLSDLLDQITAVPLLSLGAIDLVLGTLADGTTSVGTVSCSASGLEVLGSVVPTPDCSAVGAAIGSLDGTLNQLLDPLLGENALGITAGGLVMESSGTGTPNAEGVSSAFARISALSLDVAPLELDGITDDLTGDLTDMLGDLDGLLGVLDGLLADLDLDAVLGDLDPLVAELLGEVDGLDALLGQLDGVLADPGGVLGDVGGVLDSDLGGILDGVGGLFGALAVSGNPVEATAIALPGGLDALVGQVLGVLGTLPTGQGLDGLDTLGLGAVLGAVEAQSTFASAAAPIAPETPATPQTPSAPVSPTPRGSLPVTGSDLHTLFLAALAALAAGSVTVALGRPSSIDLLRQSGTRGTSRLR